MAGVFGQLLSKIVDLSGVTQSAADAATGIYDSVLDVSARLTGIAPSTPLETADYSVPYTSLSVGGMPVAAGVDTVLVPAAAGRSKVLVTHAGPSSAGRMWIALGTAAQVGKGVWLEYGGAWEEVTADSVHVYVEGSAAVTATFQEYAA